MKKPRSDNAIDYTADNFAFAKNEPVRLLGPDMDMLRLKRFQIDDDGYPTEETERCIKEYGGDLLEFFAELKNIWAHASWGWHEGRGRNNIGKWVRRFHISTGGWSGNETLIGAMKSHFLLWHACWVQHRVGGHYIFEVEKGERIPTKEELAEAHKNLVARGFLPAEVA